MENLVLHPTDTIPAVDGLLAHRIAFITALVAAGGPAPHEYGALTAWLDEVAADRQAGRLSPADIALLQQAFGEALSPRTVQGFSYSKPHGYAGDYEVIDRMYRQHVSHDPMLRNWDYFCHAQSAPRAVRNRKTYFITLLNQLAAVTGLHPAPVLNVASGPCRDLMEFFEGNVRPESALTFDCVDSDPHAIEYARTLCRPYRERVHFIQANALRFNADNRYRLVWSAGLFDYLSDKAFKFLLERLLGMLREDGELVVGNFGLDNPTRPYMEIVGDWHLHHRGPADLTALARSCGVPEANIRVGREPEGVNLFLHIKRGSTFLGEGA